jgi:hypothetical protein
MLYKQLFINQFYQISSCRCIGCDKQQFQSGAITMLCGIAGPVYPIDFGDVSGYFVLHHDYLLVSFCKYSNQKINYFNTSANICAQACRCVKPVK